MHYSEVFPPGCWNSKSHIKIKKHYIAVWMFLLSLHDHSPSSATVPDVTSWTRQRPAASSCAFCTSWKPYLKVKHDILQTCIRRVQLEFVVWVIIFSIICCLAGLKHKLSVTVWTKSVVVAPKKSQNNDTDTIKRFLWLAPDSSAVCVCVTWCLLFPVSRCAGVVLAPGHSPGDLRLL